MSKKRMVAGIDALTGEVTERELTPEEIAEFELSASEAVITFEVAPHEALIADTPSLPSAE